MLSFKIDQLCKRVRRKAYLFPNLENAYHHHSLLIPPAHQHTMRLLLIELGKLLFRNNVTALFLYTSQLKMCI